MTKNILIMFFTHLFVSALCIGAGLAANPRAVFASTGEEVLNALQALQSDVQTYGAIIKDNAAHTSILNENASAITAIHGALSNIVDSVTKTSQTIQSIPTDKRHVSPDATNAGTDILAVVSDIATEFTGLFLSLIGTITASKSWQDVTNPLLEGFTELTTILGSLLDNVPGFQAVPSLFTSTLNSLPL
ncbi:hypothetical protein OIDMADRAFT_56093 [Oidiodendron maius Zn]|uniref:Uncharacterized protein n=1 Tax=Oidiodendron maius (strain Zn) TaxID=913774 RepID=A0A0C3DAF4_OIDMZ|nr:hypothetical protein OIDMADRAFT_56093 [Oidiodendron maius Zn]